MSREVSHLDIDYAEERYRTSGDPIYIALAIGSRPHSPPTWAMLEAISLAERAAAAAIKGNRPIADGKLLDEVIRAYFAHEDDARRDKQFSVSTYVPPSFDQIIRVVISSNGLEPDTLAYDARARAIRRQWDAERAEIVDIDPLLGIPCTHRYQRILHEWGDREVGKPYSEISRILYLLSISN